MLCGISDTAIATDERNKRGGADRIDQELSFQLQLQKGEVLNIGLGPAGLGPFLHLDELIRYQTVSLAVY